jgi:hypothetical protein
MDKTNTIKILDQPPSHSIITKEHVIKKHYFLKYAIPLALSFWLLDSAIH